MFKFVHLRCHSNYSIGEGSLRILDLCEQAVKYNMPAIGICDTNNMFGAREFSDKLSSNGIKPLISIQIDTIYTHKQKHKITGQAILFCKNTNGYKNLLKIHDKAYFYKGENNLDSATILFEEILKHSKDLIFLTAGEEGIFSKILDYLNKEELNSFINNLKEHFPNDLYIELLRTKESDHILEEKFLTIAKENNLPIVATNNVLFKNIEDYNANDILICIGEGVKRDLENRKHISNEQYFKSQEEMIKLFADLPEAIENTINIAKKCNYFVDKNPLSLPKFSDDEEQLIYNQSIYGLEERLEKEVYPRLKSKDNIEAIKKEYYDRLYFELDVIVKMQFSGYFLIVSDFIKWAKNNKIPVGPGRGSGAGSLVAWCLFITDVNPLQFNLLFERFLNPERISMPDFDIDFCQDRRDEVVEYVRQKYGLDKVAHIITFGTLQARAAIKDVGRAMGLPYSEVDMISKKIPYSPPSNPINISKIINEVDALKEEIATKEHIKELFDISLKLEGLYRNTSTHAAGVVISKEPLNDIAPLFYDSGSSFPSVGFSMKYIEDIGLVKFDFLALGTLTIIQGALNMVKRTQNTDIDILQINYQDSNIANLLGSGNTLGVFQLESTGMTEVIKQMKPDRIEDIIAIISLYRPGPMENIPSYIDRKHGKEEVKYLHPKMEKILDETFGIMIYQEQVMEVAKVVAGYTLGGADILRRAMGKKDPKEMEAQKNIFIEGADKSNNINKELSTEIFEQMEKFAGYGFNKSHATAYALISWQTAYLKAYYPAEFLASSMTADIGSNKEIERFLEFLEEAKKFNIKLLPPSVNYSTEIFDIEYLDTQNIENQEDSQKKQEAIRYSLSAIKGVGTSLVEAIKIERKKGLFKSLEDFLSRIDSKLLNKRQLESLIKAGAFDEIYNNRKELIENIENLVNFNNNVFENKNSNQISLFGEDNNSDAGNILTISKNPDFTSQEKMIEELEVMGCFLSGHPLNEYNNILGNMNLKTYAEVVAKKLNGAYIAGFLMKIKLAKSKNGTNFANLTLYDKSSVFSVSLFGDIYNKLLGNGALINAGKNYIIKTNIKSNEDETRLFIESMEELHHDYKIKKAHKKELSNEKESLEQKEESNNSYNFKQSSKNLIVSLRNYKEIAFIKESVKNDTEGNDIMIIKIPYKHNIMIFELKNITLNENTIDTLKQHNIHTELG